MERITKMVMGFAMGLVMGTITVTAGIGQTPPDSAGNYAGGAQELGRPLGDPSIVTSGPESRRTLQTVSLQALPEPKEARRASPKTMRQTAL